MKKAAGIFLCIIMLIGVLSSGICTFANEGEAQENAEFVFENTDAFSVMLKKYNGNAENVIVPDSYEGRSVTEIGEYCFNGKKTVKSVKLPETVKVINERAFIGCKSLETVNLEKVEIIRRNAFSGVIKLNNIKLEKIKEIELDAFENCKSLDSLTMNTPEKIEKRAFFGSALYTNAVTQNKKALYIGKCLINAFTDRTKGKFKVKKGTKLIADYAFGKVKNKNRETVKSVYVPDSVEYIGTRSFNSNAIKKIRLSQNLKSLSYVSFTDEYYRDNRVLYKGCYYLGNCLMQGRKNKLKFKIRKGTSLIANGAFAKCIMTELVIPEGVRFIDKNAISGCQRLKTVSIPASILLIESGNLANNGKLFTKSCKKLKSIKVNTKNKVYSSSGGVLYNKDKTELIVYPNNKAGESFTLPESVKTVKAFAFAFANNLKGIVLNNGLETVENEAFANCKLTTVTIPESVKFIGKCAFGFNYYTNEDISGYFLIGSFVVCGRKGSAAEMYCYDTAVVTDYDDGSITVSNPITFKEV